ncbi:glycosyl hydrolase family 6, partial [Streptomyces xiamenensis]
MSRTMNPPHEHPPHRRGRRIALAAGALLGAGALTVGTLGAASANEEPSTLDRVDNPYVGAGVYVNPEWSANAAAEPGGSQIADQPTGVWLDRTAAIEGDGQGGGRTMGLRDHLDTAVEQAAGSDAFV